MCRSGIPFAHPSSITCVSDLPPKRVRMRGLAGIMHHVSQSPRISTWNVGASIRTSPNYGSWNLPTVTTVCAMDAVLPIFSEQGLLVVVVLTHDCSVIIIIQDRP